jgi:hypothetical protein
MQGGLETGAARTPSGGHRGGSNQQQEHDRTKQPENPPVEIFVPADTKDRKYLTNQPDRGRNGN